MSCPKIGTVDVNVSRDTNRIMYVIIDQFHYEMYRDIATQIVIHSDYIMLTRGTTTLGDSYVRIAP
jgi:hypothetical protein